jgi:DinB superfamily
VFREAELSETAQQYIARITGFVGDRDPAILLAEAPDRLRTLVERAPASALTWKPTPEAWSIAEIAAHLADAEIVGAWRIRSVLAQDNVPLQAYDQNAWASAFRYGDVPAADSVALFGVLRQATLRLLRTVDPARHQHAGLHAERGRENIPHLMRLYAGHDLNHLAQIERLLTEAR